MGYSTLNDTAENIPLLLCPDFTLYEPVEARGLGTMYR
jgi:hypothetical protein